MRLGTRFTLAFAGLGALVFGGHAWLAIAKESDDLRETALAEVSLLAQSLRVAVENALRDGQLDDLAETVAQIDISDLSTDIAVWQRSGALQVASPGQPDLPQLRAMARAVVENQRAEDAFVGAGDERYLVRAVPLSSDDGVALGALTVCRPTRHLDEDLAETRLQAVTTALAFIALTGLLGLLLGHAWVARPLVAVVRAIRRVRDGDLEGPPPFPPAATGELAELATELDGMRAELRAARVALATREREQRELEERLRDTDRMVAIGQLAGGLAHEIGSPLQVLQGRAAALLETQDQERQKKHARIIVQETSRVASIVQDLLRFVRRTPRPKPMRLDLAARAVVNLLDHQAERSGVRLTLAARPTSEITADEERILQVVLNLVRNALQATSRGGRIEVRVEPDERGAALVVKDDGRGMDEATRARIFEPFFTTRAAQGGTGLGLSVVRSIVDEHAASLEVDSAPGAGTTFRIVFPLDAPARAPETQP